MIISRSIASLHHLQIDHHENLEEIHKRKNLPEQKTCNKDNYIEYVSRLAVEDTNIHVRVSHKVSLLRNIEIFIGYCVKHQPHYPLKCILI